MPPPAVAGPAGGGGARGRRQWRAGAAGIAEPGTPAGRPSRASFRDVVALVASQREPILHGHLLHSVHLVRFAPAGDRAAAPSPSAPRDLAATLGRLLNEATGTRWTIALSTARGEPTLAEQGTAADTARRSAAAEHPLGARHPGRLPRRHASRRVHDSRRRRLRAACPIQTRRDPICRIRPLDADYPDDPDGRDL